jgi:LysR family transcriptional regulator, mexEF-oprN operon transcriptional activator
MRRSFDLNLLPVLVKIHEYGSVSAAATQLGLSQSAVSAALAKLRVKYGDPLFLRAATGCSRRPACVP